MAVKVNNTANLRRAQRWDERDDAALGVLLKRKIKDVNVALRECETPYERTRLKELKRHYKSMLRKVEQGNYNGDIIFGELQAASALRAEQDLRMAEYSTMAGGKKYINSFEKMDFDYERAFRKKRYYGVSLPLIMVILSILLIAVFFAGPILGALPAQTVDNLGDVGGMLTNLFYLKLDGANFDIMIENDGDWPSGTYRDGVTPLAQGEVYTDDQNKVPATVTLSGNLGYETIYITPVDVVKAWFHTPMLESTRLDFIEDSPIFQGDSFYYIYFLSDEKRDALVIKKDEDGNYDNSVIFRHIGTYGTIIFLIIAFILTVINLVINIVRLFTYTSRRIHLITLLSFIVTLLCALCPAFATMEGTELSGAFTSYFSSLTDFSGFIDNAEASVGIGILMLVPVIINLLLLILPFIFKNRLKKSATFVPSGNKNRSAYNDPLYVDEETLKRLV